MSLELLLDVAWSLITEGMDFRQRQEYAESLEAFTREGFTGNESVEKAQRRAYAVTYGQTGGGE